VAQPPDFQNPYHAAVVWTGQRMPALARQEVPEASWSHLGPRLPAFDMHPCTPPTKGYEADGYTTVSAGSTVAQSQMTIGLGQKHATRSALKQLKHEGLGQKHATWSASKQLKHNPTRSASTTPG
jgi:hypothetical protein